MYAITILIPAMADKLQKELFPPLSLPPPRMDKTNEQTTIIHALSCSQGRPPFEFLTDLSKTT